MTLLSFALTETSSALQSQTERHVCLFVSGSNNQKLQEKMCVDPQTPPEADSCQFLIICLVPARAPEPDFRPVISGQRLKVDTRYSCFSVKRKICSGCETLYFLIFLSRLFSCDSRWRWTVLQLESHSCSSCCCAAIMKGWWTFRDLVYLPHGGETFNASALKFHLKSLSHWFGSKLASTEMTLLQIFCQWMIMAAAFSTSQWVWHFHHF